MPRMLPIAALWDGDNFVPDPRYVKLCNRQFVVGEQYQLTVTEERSMKSHRHFFAQLKASWLNLAEEYNGRFPTTEHLRHWALVQCGYSDRMEIPCGSKQKARSLAQAFRKVSDYAVIELHQDVIVIHTAKSQSEAAMKKEQFQKSKQDVLDLVASMARTTPKELERNAGRSA